MHVNRGAVKGASPGKLIVLIWATINQRKGNTEGDSQERCEEERAASRFKTGGRDGSKTPSCLKRWIDGHHSPQGEKGKMMTRQIDGL